MNKTLCRALLLCLLTLPCTSAVADSDVTAEKNKQNTPDGWTAVQLPNIPTITEANTFNIKDYGANLRKPTTRRPYRLPSMLCRQRVAWW